ncbi:MAG: IclR family transcriptional regulator [Actinomycetota bacterium]|jgi:DNA-binding IclR family transcriptional regulator|nr:IclR family transcriptional regulator [Actinomycetota bacterium]
MPTESNAGAERVLTLLRAFAAEGPTLRVADAARMCSVGTSTASRLLTTLVASGLIDRDELGHYRLGHGIVALAGAALNGSPLYRESKGIAYAISCELGLGANIAELRDDQVFYIVSFDGYLMPRVGTLMGHHNPLHSTGLGKCLLSGRSPTELRRLLGPEPFAAYTEHTITNYEALEAELAEVRRRGYSTEREELAFGRSCVAAPIRDRSGSVIAALSISGPLSAMRLDDRENELAQRALEATDKISSALGAVPRAISADGERTLATKGVR